MSSNGDMPIIKTHRRWNPGPHEVYHKVPTIQQECPFTPEASPTRIRQACQCLISPQCPQEQNIQSTKPRIRDSQSRWNSLSFCPSTPISQPPNPGFFTILSGNIRPILCIHKYSYTDYKYWLISLSPEQKSFSFNVALINREYMLLAPSLTS